MAYELVDEALQAVSLERQVERQAAESLLEEAIAMAARVASGPPIAHRLAKLMMRQGLTMDLRAFLEMSAAVESITLSSGDHAEGMAAARQKRKPRFTGV